VTCSFALDKKKKKKQEKPRHISFFFNYYYFIGLGTLQSIQLNRLITQMCGMPYLTGFEFSLKLSLKNDDIF